MHPPSEKYTTFANLQLYHHRPLFSLTLLIMGSMRKMTFPFLTLFIVPQKLVFLSAGVQTMSKRRKKKKKKNNKWGSLPVLPLCEQGGFETAFFMG